MDNFEDFLSMPIPSSLLECSTVENRREYLTFDEALSTLNIKKEEIVSLIALGTLRPYFYWEGYLEFSEEMNLEIYKSMFNMYASSRSRESERMNDSRFTTLAYGYQFFRGYLTPHTAQPYSMDVSFLFPLHEIYIVENFTKDGKVTYEHTNEKDGKSITRTFDQNYIFDSDFRYSIHSKSPSREFSLNKCVFSKVQVDSQKDKRKNNEKINTNVVFNMVVPIIAKYLFAVNPQIKLPDEIVAGEKKGTSEKTIKAMVEEYLKEDKDLNSLLPNFEGNWQKVMNKKIGDKKRIVLIKESVVTLRKES